MDNLEKNPSTLAQNLFLNRRQIVKLHIPFTGKFTGLKGPVFLFNSQKINLPSPLLQEGISL